MKGKTYLVILVLLLVVLMSSGCYWNRQVEAYQVGLKLKQGVKIEAVLGPGRYTDFGWYSDLQPINVSALTVEWTDPDLVTKDKQPIGLSLSVTFARNRDADSAQGMWERYNAEARNDELLMAQMLRRIPRAAKAITTKYTLDQMLGVGEEGEKVGRERVQQELFDLLDVEADELYSRLLDVGINNIAPSDVYMGLLEEKANAQVRVEVAGQRKLELDEQLKAEKSQTQISIELASRERQVQEERAKVFTANERWFQLKYLEALEKVIGNNDKWFFVEPGVDLTLLLGESGVVPLER
jgi:hypothetical protein